MALFEEGQTGLRKFGSHDVEVRYDGDWIKFGVLMRSTDLLLAAAVRKGQRAFADAYRDAVVSNMESGGKKFGYAPMAPDYAAFKARKGGGGQLYRWSGTLIDSVEVTQNASGTRFMVGIDSEASRPSYYAGEGNRLTVAEYANALEHGYATRGVYVEPRPIFSDTFRFTMGGKEGIRKFIEAYIVGTFLTKRIRVTKKFRR